MHQLHLWLRGIAIASRQDPPRFIELMMLCLAMFSLIAWSIWESGYFLVLCVSYILGSSLSILVRETIAPSPNTVLIRCIVGVSALIALFCLYIAHVTIPPLNWLDHLTQTVPVRQ